MTNLRHAYRAMASANRLAHRLVRPPGQELSATRELDRYMPRLVAGSSLIAAAELIAGSLLGEPALLGSATLTAAFGLALVGAGGLIHTGRERWAGPVLATSVYLLGLLAATLIPGAATAAAMLPILSLVLIMHGRGRRTVMAILTVALGGSAVALLVADGPHLFSPLREPLGSIFAAATLLGVAVLIMGALTDFARQARESVDGMRLALLAQSASSTERTAILASIGKLERKDTLEATAGVIVDALMRLPHTDLAGVFACDDGDLELLAMTAPPEFPVVTGDRVPARRSRHLLERSREGPWAERWTGDSTYGAYGAAFSASGIRGMAYAPFFERGRLTGIIGVGTRSDGHADHLVADLPAVAEFAATASVLLNPMLVSRQALKATRENVATIIASEAFRPVFQPIIELAGGRVVGFEALTRFADGRRPDVVFGAAAEAGLGSELELATMAAALRAARDLPAHTWLSLNASPDLVVETTGLARALATRDRPVVLEITEHVAIDDYDALRTAIQRLGAGVRVAVDDAGAGIANFSHLVELRPHLVKVDAGLIRDLDTDLARQAVVVGFVHFAAKVGCEVLAEGIETEAERATAQALGVTLGQGFLMARPVPVGDLIEPALATPARVRPGRIRIGPASAPA